MGIKGLMTLLKSDAPDSYKESNGKVYKGKVLVIDASILLYQFLVQIRTKGSGYGQQLLVDDNGEVTSHIQGFFNRTANMLENGIKPVFVFDGKPPVLKHAELTKRKESKKKAEQEAEEAEQAIDEAEDEEALKSAIEELDKASKRNIHITKQQTEDVKTLLTLMGIPIINAPCEAEAQCAELVKSGKAYATATEDMDALTFGTPVVIRNIKDKVVEINMSKVLTGLEITYEQFIDFCILCGCDYCETIKGIGPKTALKLVRKHGNIETILENLPTKYIVPSSLKDNLEEVRELFKNPDVKPAKDIEFKLVKPDSEGIINFLVGQKGFSRDRVVKVIDKITLKVKVDEKQPTIDTFFKLKKKDA